MGANILILSLQLIVGRDQFAVGNKQFAGLNVNITVNCKLPTANLK